jgi:hypothetical protein
MLSTSVCEGRFRLKGLSARHKWVARPSAGKPPPQLIRTPLAEVLPGCPSDGGQRTASVRPGTTLEMLQNVAKT